MPPTTTLAESLRQAGHRLTRPRLAVLQVLERQQEGLSPQDIWKQAQALYPPVGLVTVYRTLALLDELGLADRVHSAQDCHAYASASADRHHLVCSSCHRLVDFPCQGLDELVATVEARTGFQVTEHLLELIGLCPDCQKDTRATSEQITNHRHTH